MTCRCTRWRASGWHGNPEHPPFCRHFTRSATCAIDGRKANLRIWTYRSGGWATKEASYNGSVYIDGKPVDLASVRWDKRDRKRKLAELKNTLRRKACLYLQTKYIPSGIFAGPRPTGYGYASPEEIEAMGVYGDEWAGRKPAMLPIETAMLPVEAEK